MLASLFTIIQRRMINEIGLNQITNNGAAINKFVMMVFIRHDFPA